MTADATDGTIAVGAAAQAAARSVLDPEVYDFYASGASDERSVVDNEAAWAQTALRPRVLADVSSVSLSTTVLGTGVDVPVLLAPSAFAERAGPDAQRSAARAAAAAGTIYTAVAGGFGDDFVGPRELAAEVPGPKWLQTNPVDDASRLAAVVDLAEGSGYRALVVTVDAPVAGFRTRGTGLLPGGAHADDRIYTDGAGVFAPQVGWDWIAKLRARTNLPLVLKGIVHPADARLAVEHGVDGIYVSNHGGRELDGVVPTALVLAEIVAAAGSTEVIVDGGIRSGRDVLRALALGARAVAISRPYLWGLAVAGEAGVAKVLDRFRVELHNALALTGQQRADAVAADILVPASALRASTPPLHAPHPEPTLATRPLRAGADVRHRRDACDRRRELADSALGVDLVFRTVTGTALDPSNVVHYLSKITNDAGLGHWHPHELRHSAEVPTRGYAKQR